MANTVLTLEKNEVFLSFRAEDTLSNFVCHLSDAFRRKKIKTNIVNEDSVEKGDDHEISAECLKAIEESKVSVIIFSKNYASSSRCLEELDHILECKKKNEEQKKKKMNEQVVVPVFYYVIPSDVRRQKGSYADAFVAHEERFKDKMDHKVKKWREALETAANFSGWDSSVIRSESKLVEGIVEDVVEKLHRMSACDDFKDQIGIHKRMEKVELLLDIEAEGVRVIGIWGTGSIGKTTLARAIFNRFASQFEGYYFLENVKEEFKKYGQHELQKKLISELLKEKSLNIVNLPLVKGRLRCAKVLIVLDDIDDIEQLEFLVGSHDWFGHGSRIIITTRDEEVLNYKEVDEKYEAEELNFDEALRLFLSKAFRGNSQTSDYVDLSKRVVNYAKGNPLTLKTLGSRLCSRSTKEWESELSKLERNSNDNTKYVKKKLRSV